MLTLERLQDANLKDRDASRGMRMRVLPNGPEVALQPGKTTVGSSPRCNIRIQLPGVQPLHCLILDQSNGISVRRWAGETLLNGDRLDEAQLQAGDCLQVGPARLEVVSQTNASENAVSVAATSVAAVGPTARPLAVPSILESKANTTATSAGAASPGAVDAAKAGRLVARSRARRLLAALRERQRLQAELNQRVAELERQAEQTQVDHQSQAVRLAEASAQLAEAARKRSELEAAAASAAGTRDAQLQLEIEELRQQLAESQARGETLQVERAALTDRESDLSDEISRLEHDYAQLRTRATELTNQVALLSDEVDETWQQNQSLRNEATTGQERQAVLGERISTVEHECAQYETRDTELTNQVAALLSERDELRRRNEQLLVEAEAQGKLNSAPNATQRAEIDSLCEQLRVAREEAAFRERAQAELTAERNRLREASDRLPQIEQQLRDAVADRESTSSELYRALLQLAEVEEKAGHDAAIDRAPLAASSEVEHSVREIAELQGEIEKLQAERLTAEEARHAHDKQLAELIEAHQQLAYDKTSLTHELAEIRAELSVAEQAGRVSAAHLEEVTQLQQQLNDAGQAVARSSDELAKVQAELATKKQELCDAAAAVDDREAKLAEYASQATAFAERLQLLQQELAETLTTRDELAKQCDRSKQQCEQAQHEVETLARRIEELEAQLKEPKQSTAETSAEQTEPPLVEHSSLLAQFLRSEQVCGADGSNATPASNASRSDAVGDTAAAHEHATEQSEVATSQGIPQGSYIERYAHMFAEEASNDAALPKPQQAEIPAYGEKNSGGRGFTSIPTPACPGPPSPVISNNDEESIEDYMAKLLQRVRGESSPAPSTTGVSNVMSPALVLPMTAPAGFQPESIGMPYSELATAFHPDPAKRRPSIPAPQTDLEALRALANESARRAISRHSLRKHRRSATTKVIVSALAGATSVLLMLDSPAWLSPQFITACVALLIAAYWGGETLRVWIESLRLAAKDDTDAEIEELSRELGKPLPIDVDRIPSRLVAEVKPTAVPSDEEQPSPLNG